MENCKIRDLFVYNLDACIDQYAAEHVKHGYPRTRLMDSIKGILDYAYMADIITKNEYIDLHSYAVEIFDAFVREKEEANI